ncbi:sigma-70 family RNA polymerase sigma factor [Paraglaciecola arctica]|uniref:RNA polymerase sigma factor n=1 Tax=Paraglaciecola arctica BSs20135 TaxID=493475 RepID=K6YXP7_9ALTE|nr:sigma-70 family RNA polymerase sigma factor [Paraglaciecola arctica]GAC21528.1 RNA polymerase sigma factor [Paraglaciecola arctica BSs20135]
MSFALTLKTRLFDRTTNESLMLRYAHSGDRALLSKLYDTCGNDLYHFVLTLSDPTLAKDICQKTWLKVIEKKHLYQRSGQFKAWLFTLARNQLIDEFRRNKHNGDDIEQLVDLEQNIEFSLDDEGVSAVFDYALLSLAFEQREAFCLQQEGFTLQDIASITHSPIETIKSRLRYAKDNMRKVLNKHCGEQND